MGIFSKNKSSDNDVFDSSTFSMLEEAESDSTDDLYDDNESPVPSGRTQEVSTEYGIQDAIKLMRKLPNVNSDIVVTVVKKTLESANIQVGEIIGDAEQRENSIEERSIELTSKIEELEGQIAQLNAEITELNTELEETTKVKELLQRSVEQDAPPAAASKKAEKTSKAQESNADAKAAEAVQGPTSEALPLADEA